MTGLFDWPPGTVHVPQIVPLTQLLNVHRMYTIF